jgi:hypothetical protein
MVMTARKHQQAAWRDPAKLPTMDQASFMVSGVVDSLHVGETFATVVREVRERWRSDFRDDRDPQARKVRGRVYRAAILRHLKNRNLYDSLYGSGMSELEQEITTRLYGGTR